ncbi:BON domain-containing protein [Parasediminibacterium sp. JCM 36343]|uniref:BON domain-containing protein n=1 Tax=Parasediminibacterium sp. JCM 36343 TaxID=3374279 RepID=UPI003978DF89
MLNNLEHSDPILQAAIEHSIKRNPATWNDAIHVAVIGNHAILTGTVQGEHKKIEANREAWNTPGILTVDNKIVVDETVG